MDKISEIERILSSEDFLIAYLNMEKYAMDKGIESRFGVFQHLFEQKYVFSHSILLGNKTSVCDEALRIEYIKTVLGGEYENESPLSLARSKNFLQEIQRKNLPIYVPLNCLSEEFDWNKTFKSQGYEYEDFESFFHIHNHPGKNVIPSEADIRNAFNISYEFMKDYFSLIISNPMNSEHHELFCNILMIEVKYEESFKSKKASKLLLPQDWKYVLENESFRVEGRLNLQKINDHYDNVQFHFMRYLPDRHTPIMKQIFGTLPPVVRYF